MISKTLITAKNVISSAIKKHWSNSVLREFYDLIAGDSFWRKYYLYSLTVLKTHGHGMYLSVLHAQCVRSFGKHAVYVTIVIWVRNASFL